MKRLICIFLSIVICFCLCACSTSTQNMRSPVNFYYRTNPVRYDSDLGVIAAEVRDARSHAEDYQYLLEQYLNGPRTANRVSPFPAGTSLKEFSLNETSATVILSPHLTMLSDSELMIACICLARTLFDLTGVKSVQVGAQNNLLNNEQYITITTDNFALWDSNLTMDN